MSKLVRLPGGGRLAFSVKGAASDAPPILLNRPLGGSMALWGDFAETLARDFQVIAFDPRGVGASSDVPWRFSTRAMARDAVALLDHLEVQKAHVFGLSLGGMVASWIASDAPARVARLVLASTLPEPAAVSPRVERHALPLLRATLKPGIEAEVALVREILSPEFRAEHGERTREIEACVRRTPSKRRNLLLLALSAALHGGEAALAGNRVRTLLLFGARDPVAGRASQQELLRDLPNATLEIVAGAGHDLSLEKPVEVAERVIDFLRAP